MKPYSLDLREKVVAAYEAGAGTQKEIAARFCVSLPWVKKLLGQKRKTGSISPKPHRGGRKAKFTGERLEALRKAVEQHPDATLEELLVLTQVSASVMAVHRALKCLGCRRKKNRCAPASRTGRTSKPGGWPGGRTRVRSIPPG